ncbi:hypothetical protein UFOVP1077_10 [uncultured Caudovirales phage]|uniref:Lipoprotein n=1 Tax=uncultured Caudovirales phage TaxID=2100421 RepID=A0A6J5RVK5_9CAUD|nr:hypothetical protein UFOVP1077_10 [uncultured Caudovirales phage]CAB4198156.1 hypothetical protein UFOVP1316_53 [uncultured Caudovirales phage]CAB4211333.1 hypothetical protein UFOVP1428_7 [uncultured Caudovirales phage]CAB5227388.1 hypothetical protein UFOVP1526_37 [uncultured Caudovirales phage]
MKRFFALFATMFLLTGCATLQSNEPVAKLTIQVGVMKYVEAAPDRAVRAARVVDVVTQAKTLVDLNEVTLADVQAAVLVRLRASGLQPSDLILASALLDIVSNELNVKIGGGVLSADQKVTVNNVLGWVSQAASFY